MLNGRWGTGVLNSWWGTGVERGVGNGCTERRVVVEHRNVYVKQGCVERRGGGGADVLPKLDQTIVSRGPALAGLSRALSEARVALTAHSQGIPPPSLLPPPPPLHPHSLILVWRKNCLC